MKRNLIFMLSGIFCALILTSQPANCQDLGFGIRAGVNIANFSGENQPPIDYNSRIGPILGVVLIRPLSGLYAIHIEALYSAKGGEGTSKVTDLPDELNFSNNLKVNYMEFPVLFKIPIVGNNTIGLHANLGPAFALKFSGERRSKLLIETEETVNEEFSMLDLGIVVGLGFEIGVGGNMISLDARYNYGFTSLSNLSESADSDLKNKTISITMGYLF